jgi:flavin reductase (DIM6/NTAB) family NADH-FMN oxidoreductase RutF
VKIAYSIPRKIYLVTVGSGKLFNIFPTDLSGQICKDYFIISLRTGGKANEQIKNEGKCLVSVMEAEFFEEVYKAGKNHMKNLSEITDIGIQLRDERSSELKLPVPLGTIKYYELETVDKFEIGIHTLHFLRVSNSVELSKSLSDLAHIHRDYAGWRVQNGIPTNYLFRKYH